MEARALAVILAAGEGKRMQSVLPKVLHRLAGKPLIEHVLQASLKAEMVRTVIVVGHRRDMVIEALNDYPIEFVVQEPQLGTGHAMQQVVDHVGPYGGTVLVLLGDAPFILPETMLQLLEKHRQEGNLITMLTAEVEDPSGYGRVVRGGDGQIERIVEEADATDEERAIAEINSGIGCFEYEPLARALVALQTDNEQGEYYLTDAIGILRAEGGRVAAMLASDPVETWGINDFQQLRDADRIWRNRHQTIEAEETAKTDDETGAVGEDGGPVDGQAAGVVGARDQVYHSSPDDLPTSPPPDDPGGEDRPQELSGPAPDGEASPAPSQA